MPVPDLSIYKVAVSEVSSATKFNNLVQAVQDEFGDIDPDQIPGYPASAARFLRGDGAWAGAYGTYVPTLTAPTSPTLGTGSSAAGEFLQVGNLINFAAEIVFGTAGVAAGSGIYGISLPAAGVPAQRLMGIGWILDSSAGLVRLVSVEVDLADTTRCIFRIDNAGVGQVTNAAPWVWAASDALRITGTYRAA